MKSLPILLLLCLTVLQVEGQGIANDKLVLYLPFNGNAQDASGNNYHGVVKGATLTTGKDNQPNTAYYFNGKDNSIVIPNVEKLAGELTAFTILVRLQPDSLVPDPTVTFPFGTHYNVLYWHRNRADETMAFHKARIRLGVQPPSRGTEPGKGFIGYIMDWCTSSIGTASGYVKDSVQMSGKWITIAFIYKEGKMLVYDGSCEKNNWNYPVKSDMCGDEPAQLTIGSVPDGALQFGNRYFRGKIDELRIYSRAISLNELEEYVGGPCVVTPPRELKPLFKVVQHPCFSNRFTFEDITDTAGFVINRRRWLIDGVAVSDQPDLDFNFSATGRHVVTMELFTDTGKVALSQPVMVSSLAPKRFIKASASEWVVCEGNSFKASVTGGKTFQWSPCSYLDNCTLSTPVIKPEQNIHYTITAEDEFGCRDTAQVKVIVQKDNHPVYVPGAFTPDGNFLNDEFAVSSSVPLTDFSLSIYNRWGQCVFQSKNQHDKWNGKQNNTSLPAGMYVWFMRYKSGSGCGTKESKGTVMLMR